MVECNHPFISISLSLYLKDNIIPPCGGRSGFDKQRRARGIG